MNLPVIPRQDDEISLDSEAEKDYKAARVTYHQLIQMGQEALHSALDLAQQLDKPSGYDAVANLLKTVTETNDKLMQLQKDKKELKKSESGKTEPGQITNNNLYMTTKDLMELLHGKKDD